ncbi:MAG TPA: hypothetical protein VNO83_16260 [Pseudonocardia sp.]|nr:hypothetical protein [Pseudonocardia sp.]
MIRCAVGGRIPGRRALAASWEKMINGDYYTPYAPVRWSAVTAAAPEIRRLVTALRTEQPVPARGVALAHVLLTDGTGPLFHHQPDRDLAAAVRDAVQCLDPSSRVNDL